MTTLIHCLNCHKKIPRFDAYVDRIGQFPKLNVKAMEMGRRDVEICQECFEKLTENTTKSHRSGVFGYS